MVVGTGGSSLWRWERECPVQEDRVQARQREAQSKQPEGPIGRRMALGDYGWRLAIMQGESIAQAVACLAQGHEHRNVRPVI